MAPISLTDPVPVRAAVVDRITLADSVFISDLHLSEHTPATLEAFERFMRETAPRHPELVILGDLFEFWTGDDDLAHNAAAQRVVAACERNAQRGQAIYLMHGNRDFLLGRGFAVAANVTLLADPTVAVLAGQPTLLAHGDAYCLDDVAYQRFRADVRSPARQQVFLMLPRMQRIALATAARAQSQTEKAVKAMDIMDVRGDAIDAALRAANATRMIHGHTHRPAVHRFTLDGRDAVRWVLPDWDFDHAARGGYLRLAHGALEAAPLVG